MGFVASALRMSGRISPRRTMPPRPRPPPNASRKPNGPPSGPFRGSPRWRRRSWLSWMWCGWNILVSYLDGTRGITPHHDISRHGECQPGSRDRFRWTGARRRDRRAGPASGLGGHGQASPVRERSDVAGGRHGGIALVVRRLVAVVGAPGTAKEAHAAAVGRQAVEDPLEVVLAHDDEVGADVDGDRAVRVDPDGQVVGFRVASTHGLSLPRSPR